MATNSYVQDNNTGYESPTNVIEYGRYCDLSQLMHEAVSILNYKCKLENMKRFLFYCEDNPLYIFYCEIKIKINVMIHRSHIHSPPDELSVYVNKVR